MRIPKIRGRKEGSGYLQVVAVSAVGTGVAYGTIEVLDRVTNFAGISQPGSRTESTERYERKQLEKSNKKNEE